MKQTFSLLVTLTAITILFGCSPQMLPLKGSYLDKPFEMTSDKSVDSVWSNIIDLFATKGLSIKVIDKNSGLIVSEKTSLMSHYTFEDDNGKLKDPNAWIVLSKIRWMGTDVTPERLTGEWNVRIKSAGGGKTTINVNLTNIEGTRHYSQSQYTTEKNFVFDGRSTGKFEQLIAELVK
jgi:hypothetical protein